MATEVLMPQMGESIAEGTITRWLVKVGEKVERDQPLFEISTDKVDADGKYTTTSPSSNDTKGWLVLVNTRMWTVGFRRDLQIESFRDIQKDQNILVASFRQAQISSGIATTHTAVGRNITV